MDKVLKACPFCGRQVVSADVSGGGPKYWIDCYQCEAVGPVTDGYDNIKQSWNRRPIEDALRAERDAAVARAEAAGAEAALLRTDSAILGRELSEANRLLLSGIPQQRGAAAERTAIAHTLKARAAVLRDRKALGAAEEVEALAFYVEQRGEVADG